MVKNRFIFDFSNSVHYLYSVIKQGIKLAIRALHCRKESLESGVIIIKNKNCLRLNIYWKYMDFKNINFLLFFY